jgi:hypothetical protein
MIVNTSDVGIENRTRTFRILEMLTVLRNNLKGK